LSSEINCNCAEVNLKIGELVEDTLYIVERDIDYQEYQKDIQKLINLFHLK
jgi:hypothetical protein